MRDTTRKRPPLAELHSHMYGSITSADFLAHVRDRDIDWSDYESAYEAAYGVHPEIRELIGRLSAGEVGAEKEFHGLFVFGDEDAGNFDRFMAKYNVLLANTRAGALKWDENPFQSAKDEIVFF